MESVFIGGGDRPTMRSAPRLTALLIVVALLLAGGAIPAATATGPSAQALDAPAAALDAPAAALDAPANTTVEVRLRANASARLTVQTTYVLESDEERSAFAEYAAAYRAGETDDGPRADPFVAAAARAAAASGRDMAVTNVTRDGGVTGATGNVSVSFRWTNFLSRTGNDTLRLDDSLSLGGGGTWLGSLDEDQALVVRTPPGYSIVDSSGPSFEIRDNAVRFEGPREFETTLTVTYRQTAPTTPEPPDQGLPWGLLGGGAAVLVLVLAVGYTLTRDRGPGPATADGVTSGDGGGPPTGDGPAPAVESESESTDADETDEEDETEAEGVDLELLSDDERVERLLERNGGRMKQAAIVDETGWSDAKVSQLLSSMADDGRVEKLRLGRENLISLPDDGDEGKGESEGGQ
jgi:hypothetical protein